MLTVSERARLLRILAKAQTATEERLRAAPSYAVLKSIKAQLDAIRADVERGTAPSPAIAERLLLAVYAVREFDETDPEFSTLLSRTEYYYKHPSAPSLSPDD